MERIIISVMGKDQVGIIGKVCTFLSENDINILDISQTILSGIFNMVLIADIKKSSKSFDEVATALAALGDDLGFEIRTQREEIFTAMHRI